MKKSTEKRSNGMLYLFCNFDFGLPFIFEIKKYCTDNKIRLIVILSGKRRFPVNKFLKTIKRLLVPIKDLLNGIILTLKFGVPIQIIADINSLGFIKKIHHDDHGIVAGFNQIFKEPTINAFGSLVNIHPSVLPLYRGPMPTYWCLKNGEQKSGYTVHRITTKIDKGEILFQEMMSITSFEDPMKLSMEIARKASQMISLYLNHIFFDTKFEKCQLDAFDIYETHVGYLSFPDGYSS